MSRSKRKHKIFGITTAASEKKDKVFHHRKMRKKIKSQIQKGDFESPFPIDNEVSNPWTWDKDGKQYWPDATDKDLGK